MVRECPKWLVNGIQCWPTPHADSRHPMASHPRSKVSQHIYIHGQEYSVDLCRTNIRILKESQMAVGLGMAWNGYG